MNFSLRSACFLDLLTKIKFKKIIFKKVLTKEMECGIIYNVPVINPSETLVWLNGRAADL